jgi:hypothetical protein
MNHSIPETNCTINFALNARCENSKRVCVSLLVVYRVCTSSIVVPDWFRTKTGECLDRIASDNLLAFRQKQFTFINCDRNCKTQRSHSTRKARRIHPTCASDDHTVRSCCIETIDRRVTILTCFRSKDIQHSCTGSHKSEERWTRSKDTT